jgi:hypothetical protein
VSWCDVKIFDKSKSLSLFFKYRSESDELKEVGGQVVGIISREL